VGSGGNAETTRGVQQCVGVVEANRKRGFGTADASNSDDVLEAFNGGPDVVAHVLADVRAVNVTTEKRVDALKDTDRHRGELGAMHRERRGGHIASLYLICIRVCLVAVNLHARSDGQPVTG